MLNFHLWEVLLKPHFVFLKNLQHFLRLKIISSNHSKWVSDFNNTNAPRKNTMERSKSIHVKSHIGISEIGLSTHPDKSKLEIMGEKNRLRVWLLETLVGNKKFKNKVPVISKPKMERNVDCNNDFVGKKRHINKRIDTK